MKRILTIVSVLSLVMASGAMAEDYGWSLSGSAVDATVNTLPPLAGAPMSVWMHLECAPVDGMAAAEFSLSSTFGFLAGFTPLNGTLNAGTQQDMLLAVGGCPGAGFVAGVHAVIDFTGLGGELCLVPSPGGVNGTVDCDVVAPLVHPNAVRGFSTNGSAPCDLGLCGTVSVEDSSWGTIKGLYR